MKIFSLLKSGSFVNIHPQEDYFTISKKYPIFVVADGVSINYDNEKEYPKRSGAGEVAKIFCETVMAEAEKRYEEFSEADLQEIFKLGNKAVLEYNISQGRTEKTINYFDVDLFSATTSFLLVKGDKAFWWSLCDAGVLLCDKDGIQKFQSPDGWINFPKNWKEDRGDKEKIILRHKDYRNKVQAGKLIGYGVVDGEESAIAYLNTGVVDLSEGDLVFVYTDGFENYFGNNDFINIFTAWPADLKNKLENFIAKKTAEDQSKYGREKTTLAISI